MARRVRKIALLAVLLAPVPLHAQAQSFPAAEFEANLATARELLAYDRCAWRSTDALLRQPRSELTGLSPVWMCLQQEGMWHGLYGRFDAAADRYEVRFHFELAGDSVSPGRRPVDTTRVAAAARALAATLGSMPEAFTRTRARFNTYVVFRGDSALSVWVLPAWQENGVALFGGEARYDYGSDGRVLTARHVIEGPIRGTRPDSSVAFRVDSNGSGVPTVGDLFFFFLMRPYFASIRIQTDRYSSTIVRTDKDEAWVHVARAQASE